ncbi:MAG: hypothetical protein GXY91_08205 [Clostridia bacterium]|nr:hypothetical protein [Clostridia bacterium]
MKSILIYIKKEVVLCISLLLAVVSMVFVPLDNKYISYIDFHTLTILLSLMIIMAGLRSLGIFSMIGCKHIILLPQRKKDKLLFISCCSCLP